MPIEEKPFTGGNGEPIRQLPPQPGPRARAILDVEAEYLSPGLRMPTELVWDRANGCEVFDVDGNRYVDFTSGVIVTNTGHCHPRIVDAIREQAGRLLNCYAAPHPLRAALVERLAEVLPERLKCTLLLTTGAEAVESAIKLARRATGRNEIVSFEGSFHGRTHMALAAGGLRSVKEGFGVMPAGVLHVPFPYPYRCEFAPLAPAHDCSDHVLAAIERLLLTQSSGDVAAVLLEPYEGAAGSLVATARFARGLRELCDHHGLIMIVDEVQSGFGRTGTLFAFEQWGIVPDIVVLGKGMASGMPISAVVASNDLMDVLPPGSMSSTYGGNPLACAAALATLDVILDERLPERAARLGRRLMDELRRIQVLYPLVGDVRGMGLAIGVELVRDTESKEPAPLEARAIVERAIACGLVLVPPIGLYGNVIRIAPPLTISDTTLEEGLAILERAIAGLPREIRA